MHCQGPPENGCDQAPHRFPKPRREWLRAAAPLPVGLLWQFRPRRETSPRARGNADPKSLAIDRTAFQPDGIVLWLRPIGPPPLRPVRRLLAPPPRCDGATSPRWCRFPLFG